MTKVSETANNEPCDMCRLWLLDVAYEGYISLSMIVGREEYLKGQWNRPVHGASREQLADELQRLASEGLICFLDHASEAMPTLDRATILAAFDDRKNRDLAYGLTASGGAEWERIVKPNWDWCDEFEWPEEEYEEYAIGQFKIRAISREAAEDLLEYACRRWYIEIDVDSVAGRWVRPWPVTYWKSLAAGYELSFRGTQVRPSKYLAAHWHYLPPDAREQLETKIRAVVAKQENWHRPPWPTASK